MGGGRKGGLLLGWRATTATSFQPVVCEAPSPIRQDQEPTHFHFCGTQHCLPWHLQHLHYRVGRLAELPFARPNHNPSQACKQAPSISRSSFTAPQVGRTVEALLLSPGECPTSVTPIGREAIQQCVCPRQWHQDSSPHWSIYHQCNFFHLVTGTATSTPRTIKFPPLSPGSGH